uniref:Uncharacterized protein n=1 Tax=Rhizophora mucronata TaxID=61149 RepID=A0A2P2N153_RHIMU
MLLVTRIGCETDSLIVYDIIHTLANLFEMRFYDD